MFVYVSIEFVGVVVGEMVDVCKVLLKVINSVMWCIVLFYVGLVVLLMMLLLWIVYSVYESLFVMFFSKFGVLYVGMVMNVVVLMVVLLSLNFGFYLMGCVLCLFVMGGLVLCFVLWMNVCGVLYGGILIMVVINVIGVLLNYIVLV